MGGDFVRHVDGPYRDVADVDPLNGVTALDAVPGIDHRWPVAPAVVTGRFRRWFWVQTEPVLRIKYLHADATPPMLARLIFPKRWEARVWRIIGPGLTITLHVRFNEGDWHDIAVPVTATWL